MSVNAAKQVQTQLTESVPESVPGSVPEESAVRTKEPEKYNRFDCPALGGQYTGTTGQCIGTRIHLASDAIAAALSVLVCEHHSFACKCTVNERNEGQIAQNVVRSSQSMGGDQKRSVFT